MVTTINKLKVAEDPQRTNVIRATCRINTSTFPDKTKIFVKNPWFEGSNEAFLGDIDNQRNPKYFQTQIETVARMGAGWDHVEVIAYVPREASPQEIPTDGFEIVYDDTADPLLVARQPRWDTGLISRLRTPENLVFKVYLKDQAEPAEVSLTDPQYITGFHRRGRVMVTAKSSAAVPNNGGWLQWWWTLYAGAPQAQLTLNWHNGECEPTGGYAGQGDVVFEKVVLDDGTPDLFWNTEISDPSINFQTRELVKPVPGGGYHVLPMRYERHWRLMASKFFAGVERRDKTWGYVTDTLSGFFPEDLGVELDQVGNLRIDQDYATETQRFLSVLPSGYDMGQTGGSSPVSFMWPTRGDRYGGTTGGTGMKHFEGCRWLASGKINGRLMHMTDMIRINARQQGCLYQDGEPIVPDDYANAGQSQWKMFNRIFQEDGGTIRDDAFGFTAFAPRTSQDPYPTGSAFEWPIATTGEAAYTPQVFDTVDDQHLLRAFRSQMALVWLDNDPLAKQCLTMSAVLSRMTRWEGTVAYGAPLRQTSAMVSNEVLTWGREDAFGAIVQAFAYAINDDEYRRLNESSGPWKWLDEYSKSLIQSQTNSTGGGFAAKNSGRVPQEIPFDTFPFQDPPNYWVQRTNEDSHLCRSMWMIGQVLGGSRLDDNAESCRLWGQKIWDRCWRGGTNSAFNKVPVGSYGTGTPLLTPLAVYADQAAIPSSVLDDMFIHIPESNTYEQLGVGLGVAGKAELYLGTTTNSLRSALLQFTNGAANFDEAQAIYNSWDAIATPGGAPCPAENYIALQNAIYAF